MDAAAGPGMLGRAAYAVSDQPAPLFVRPLVLRVNRPAFMIFAFGENDAPHRRYLAVFVGVSFHFCPKRRDEDRTTKIFLINGASNNNNGGLYGFDMFNLGTQMGLL